MLSDSYAREADEWRREHALIPAFDVNSFFKMLEAESTKPHSGDQYREFVRNMLVRAQEAGIYSPEP